MNKSELDKYLVKISYFNNSCTFKAQLMSYASTRKTYMYKQWEEHGFQSHEIHKEGVHVVMTNIAANSQYEAIQKVINMYLPEVTGWNS